ncbi:MAG: phosphate acyltransferase PlsX [Phenylobacterium sp.]|uniref:phosphate acyltransferase PlsX n=1 Tax=Phenylobacterium sp. TaxID=1871053 RepID=UPI002726366C|nr:phosphate acyltransferase PlsX [Phenylobacterium sp.]MDO8902192.1 phosphate acyltransferase PlsX [Phenylobacterium sp.]MDP2212663.1 phosphate acyltransferase PlsX [Phenylobacterium sp.]
MSQSVTISIDAMGGDHGPAVTIPALGLAARRLGTGARFLAHGDAGAIEAELARLPELADRVEVRHTDKVVASDEKPATALRRGKGSSMWNAVETVKLGEAGGAVSAGNTGALMAISKLILRMSADLDRPCLTASWPTARGFTTVLDVGANVDCDAARLVEFAILGEAFHRAAHGVERPTIGLLNVGSEDIKGHEEVREAHRILREGGVGLNYYGFVEGDDLTRGVVDVVVTDGFTGNVALKTAEGVAKFISGELRAALTSSLGAKLGALMARKALLAFRERLSPPAAAPLLGLNGVVVKSHGGAEARDFADAIQVAADLARSGFAAEITRSMIRLGFGARPAAVTADQGGE